MLVFLARVHITSASPRFGMQFHWQSRYKNASTYHRNSRTTTTPRTVFVVRDRTIADVFADMWLGASLRIRRCRVNLYAWDPAFHRKRSGGCILSDKLADLKLASFGRLSAGQVAVDCSRDGW